MSPRRIVLILLGLLLLAGIVSAGTDLTKSTIISNMAWLTAGSGGQSTIAVTVLSPQLTPIPGATVTFTVADPTMGTISPASVLTGADGKATAVFTVGTKSGTAVIDALISYPNGDGTSSNLALPYIQNIDHSTPESAVFTALSQVPVGSVTPLNITLTDQYGNPINNINPADVTSVTLNMNGGTGAGFISGSTTVAQLSAAPDMYGNVSVNAEVSTVAGSNIITMSPVGYVGTQVIDIEGVPAVPATLSQTLTPLDASSCSSGTSCPADGTHPFNLYYTLQDQYGNPVSGAPINITALSNGVASSYQATTDTSGVAYAQYIQATAGTYNLTAQTAGNSSLLCTSTNAVGGCSQSVTYYATNPVDMELMVNPQMMVSRDVSSTSSAAVMARVMDANGNPVQTYQGAPMNVTFFLSSSDTFPGAPTGNPYVESGNSSLSATTANMANNGFAAVTFYPGAFVTYGQTGYNATATGQTTISALWTSPAGTPITRTATVLWKNYPYLSISSNTSTSNTVVGGNVTITVTVNGNGAALLPKPIDVILCIDRSGSMLEGYSNTNGAVTDKIIASQAAGTTFAKCLTVSRDRIGVVSFADDSATSGWANLSPTAGYTYNSKTKTYSLSSWNWNNVYGYSSQHQIGSDSNAVNPWAWVAEPANGQTANVGQFNCGSNCPGTGATGYDTTSQHWQILSANFNSGNPKYYGNGVYNSTDLAFGYYQGQNSVQTALKTIVPAGGTPMRYGLWSAVSQLIANPPPQSGTVRAVILQTDGEWNTGGDPEGGSGAASLSGPGTGSILTWAHTNGIRIYTIGLGSDVNAAELTAYATETNGTYYAASDASQLNGIYTAIAGQLNQQAGGNTSVVTNFGSISVGGVSVSNVGNYLSYQYNPPGSTYVNMYNTNPSGIISEYNGYPYSRNDTRNWTNNKNFMFSIGTIVLNDTWTTSFNFIMLQNGTYTLFGPNTNSNVAFNDSSTGMTTSTFIPSLLITVRNSTILSGLNGDVLVIDNLSRTDTGAVPNLVGLQWNTTYTGVDANNSVIEEVLYRSTASSQWNTYSPNIAIVQGPTTGAVNTAYIDTSTWDPGAYVIEIVGEASYVPNSYATITYTKSSQAGAYIKLE